MSTIFHKTNKKYLSFFLPHFNLEIAQEMFFVLFCYFCLFASYPSQFSKKNLTSNKRNLLFNVNFSNYKIYFHLYCFLSIKWFEIKHTSAFSNVISRTNGMHFSEAHLFKLSKSSIGAIIYCWSSRFVCKTTYYNH